MKEPTYSQATALDEGVAAPGDAILEEIGPRAAVDTGTESLPEDEMPVALKKAWVTDPATRVALITGFFSMVITLLGVLLG